MDNDVDLFVCKYGYLRETNLSFSLVTHGLDLWYSSTRLCFFIAAQIAHVTWSIWIVLAKQNLGNLSISKEMQGNFLLSCPYPQISVVISSVV